MAHTLIQTIAYAAGKSGGHIVPCLTLALQWQEQTPHTPLFFTTQAALDQQIIERSPLPIDHVMLSLHHPYGAWYKKPLLLWNLLIAFVVSLSKLWKTAPTKIVTTGGLTAIPVCCAAYLLRIPIELYELNAIPGKAARVIGYCATHIYVCFADAQPFFNAQRCSRIAYPIRYTRQEKMTDQRDAQRALGFEPHIPMLLILGGSQGSQRLNNMVKQIIAHHGTSLNVIHQTGGTDLCDWQSWYKNQNIPAHVFAYNDHLAPYIAASDLVVCRAGAGTLFETLFFNKPCLIIPLEGVADDHQVANAYAMQKKYPALCTVLRQHEIEKDAKALYNEVVKKLVKKF
jgi:UDP-N-acetylglucosamine--N-acetylmuramyl-(pentapeptide) pyrophosphoryl-undecaprenol N-acetylglucosamine transferase